MSGALADDLDSSHLPGITGPIRTARAFADAWSARSGAPARIAMAQRIYALDRVEPPSGASGSLRSAETGDLGLVRSWFLAFNEEAGDGPSVREDLLGARLSAGAVVLWEDRGAPVSVAMATGPTPNGIRIGGVYTPPDLRSRGYASACVAALSQRELDTGRTLCFLFTDLANPTSNKIYQAIGYRPVCDVHQWAFDYGG